MVNFHNRIALMIHTKNYEIDHGLVSNTSTEFIKLIKHFTLNTTGDLLFFFFCK